MAVVEKLWFPRLTPASLWSPQFFWGSVPLAGLFTVTGLVLARRRGAKTLPAVLLLTLIGLARDRVELAVEWFFLGLIWELYWLARLLTSMLP